MTKSQKRRLCQLISVTLCSLFWISWPLKMRLIGCPEMLVGNSQSTLCNTSYEDLVMQALV